MPLCRAPFGLPFGSILASIWEVIFNALEAGNRGFSGVRGKLTSNFGGQKEVKKEGKREDFQLPKLWISGSPKIDFGTSGNAKKCQNHVF